MKGNKQISKVTKKKLLHLLDQSTPSASPIHSTPSEFSPGLSVSSETASVSDLTSSSLIITEPEKDELVSASVDPFGFNSLKFDSIREELLTSHGYELMETNDMDVGLMEAEVVAECLKVARNRILQAKDLDLSSKKLLNRLIEVIIREEFCGLSEEIGSSMEIQSAKFPIMIMLLLLFIFITIASCVIFFSTDGEKGSFNGALPT